MNPLLTSIDSDIVDRTRRIASDVSGPIAAAVDKDARFPTETFNALRKAKLLSAACPRELGGNGASLQELAASCMELARACPSSGMILAMHHIQVACLVRHCLSSGSFRDYLLDLVEHQYLVGSATSEVGVWGDIRSSICALERGQGCCRLRKDAATVSYGETADALLVTCRRGPDSPRSDQLLILLRKDDYRLEQSSTWDTLGMRGTQSPGFRLSARFPEDRLVPVSFADVSAQTMVPYSHVLWSAVWCGIAADAVSRAAAYVRDLARRTPETVPAQASRLAQVSVRLQSMCNDVAATAAEFDAIATAEEGRQRLLAIGWALKMNNLKVASSQAAPRIVHGALQVIGIGAYRNDSRFSLTRHYRDALSAELMISNDRIYDKNAAMLLVYKDQ